MAEPSMLERTVTALRPLIPARFRTDIPIVPVVRLSGVIGISTPLKPGLTLANVARSLDRAFSHEKQPARSRLRSIRRAARPRSRT